MGSDPFTPEQRSRLAAIETEIDRLRAVRDDLVREAIAALHQEGEALLADQQRIVAELRAAKLALAMPDKGASA